MKPIFVSVFILLLFITGCVPSASELEFTSMAELNTNPSLYVDEIIKVRGRVVESLGEDSYFLLLPYVTTKPCKIGDNWTICTDVKISLSQVRVQEFVVQEEDRRIIVSEKTGGLYLPIPVILAGDPSLPEGELVIVGTWKEKDKGQYVLYVSGSDVEPTPLP